MSNEGRGDWLARLGFAVLARVTEIGANQVDFLGGGTAESIDENQGFHQVLVNRRTSRLDDEDLLPANGIHGLADDFPRREAANTPFPESHAQDGRDARS